VGRLARQRAGWNCCVHSICRASGVLVSVAASAGGLIKGSCRMVAASSRQVVKDWCKYVLLAFSETGSSSESVEEGKSWLICSDDVCERGMRQCVVVCSV
jgi:hypothetical protein